MDEDREKQLSEMKSKASSKGKAPQNRPSVQRKGRKRARVESDDSSDEETGTSKRKKGDDGQARPQGNEDDEPPVFEQPAAITGAKLKNYQLEGLQWMVSLDQNGISGILGQWSFFQPTGFLKIVFSFAADEMGLGKVSDFHVT